MASLLGAILLFCQPLLAEVDFEHPPLCEAYVFADRAEFLFPILDIGEWRWHRKETAKDKLEYAWEVMIPAQKPEYVFGVYLAKSRKARQKTGALDRLLADTSWNAVRLVPDDSGVMLGVSLPKTQLSVDLEGGGVVLSLLGKDTRDKFFTEKPKSVLFNLMHPDEIYSINCIASVSYRTGKNSPGYRDDSWKLPLP